MLKPSRQDWPLLAALVAIALVLWLLWITSATPHYEGGYPGAQQHQQWYSPLGGFWHWVTKDSISFFTAVLAGLTGALVLFGGWQASLTRQTIDLARDEFNATHRPKIDIRLIRMAQITPGTDISITWCAANIGDAPARIFESNATITFGAEPLPAVPIYDADKSSMNGPWIAPGIVGTCTKRFPVKAWDWFSYQKDQALKIQNEYYIPSAPIDLYFFGYALYEGADKQRRSVAFCRRYNFRTQRFDVVADPNYEHTA